MSYYCTTCEETVESRICPTCGQVAEPLEAASDAPAEAPPPPPPPSPPPPSKSEPLSPLLRRPADKSAGEERREEAGRVSTAVAEPPASPSPTPEERVTRPMPGTADRAVIGKAAQRELAHFVEQGYEIYLVAGIYQAGKSQFLDACRQVGYLGALEDQKRAGKVMPTAPGTLKCVTFAVDGRKVAFVDAAGESFKQLYPYLRETEITPEAVSFLELLSKNLCGLVLLLDLQSLWHPDLRDKQVENTKQEQILGWTLALIRWLRLGGEYRPGALGFREQVDSQVKVLDRRLDVPVLVLFSKADALGGLEIGGGDRTGWMRRGSGGDGSRRSLRPLGEQPLLLARHRLSELYGAVRAHAEHFRFDFVHSVVTDPDTGVVLEQYPACGVDYSIGWLLDPGWQRPSRFLPTIPSRVWIDLQERLDKLTGRGGRWRRLPPPEEFP